MMLSVAEAASAMDWVERVGIWCAIAIGMMVGLYRVVNSVVTKGAPIVREVADTHIRHVEQTGKTNARLATAVEHLADIADDNKKQLGQHGKKLDKIEGHVAELRRAQGG